MLFQLTKLLRKFQIGDEGRGDDGVVQTWAGWLEEVSAPKALPAMPIQTFLRTVVLLLVRLEDRTAIQSHE